MAAEINEILTRENALRENYTPTGRKVGAVPLTGYNLWKVQFVDDKPGPKDVTDIAGTFTRREYADAAIRAYLEEFWDKSDKAAKRAA